MDLVDLRMLVIGGLLLVAALSATLTLGVVAVARWAGHLADRRPAGGQAAWPGGARLAHEPGRVQC